MIKNLIKALLSLGRAYYYRLKLSKLSKSGQSQLHAVIDAHQVRFSRNLSLQIVFGARRLTNLKLYALNCLQLDGMILDYFL